MVLRIEDAPRAALGILKHFWMDGTRLSVPVDPARIAKDLNIDVVEAELRGDTSGMIVKRAEENAIIFLQRTNSETRKRFSCAHELGHYVDHAGMDWDNDGAIDEVFAFVDEGDEFTYHRDQDASTGLHRAERFANAFAAELLMPAWAVRMAVDEAVSTAEVAGIFGVSADAMGYRLKNLRLHPG